MIIICDECKQYVCPSSCPSYEGRSLNSSELVGACSRCDEILFFGDEYYRREGGILCRECAEELVSSELLDFLDCDDVKDFFDMLW